MDIRRLRYFLVLAEELHFGRAANRLAISQPPLSVNIRQLEETLGVRLFERNSQGVRLTAAGEALVPAAQALIERMDVTISLVRDVEKGITGHLRIGFVGSLLYRGLPQLLENFQRGREGLQLHLQELNSGDQLLELSHNSLDVGFVHASQLPGGLSSLPFSSEPFVACLAQQHPLAGRSSLALRELYGERFIVFARSVSPYYYDHIQSICAAAGVYPDVRYEARHWLSVVSLAAQGMGVALVPACLRHSALSGAKFIPLEDVAALSRIDCVWRESDRRPAVSAFVIAVRGIVTGMPVAPAG